MADRMKGKTVVVTGASSGIGHATAIRMAQEGASVALLARRRDKLEAVAAEVRAAGGEALVMVVDVGDSDAYRTAIEAAAAHFGRLDAIVNNAMHEHARLLIDIPMEEWHEAFRVNVDALLVAIQAAFRLMPKNGGGSVVNISSTCGVKALATMGSYSASKAAGQHLAAIAAMEGAQYGVRVNSILPGFVRTPGLLDWADGNDELLRILDGGNPMGRIGEPNELANAILFLCSDDASYVNGAALPVDGGHVMRIHTPG